MLDKTHELPVEAWLRWAARQRELVEALTKSIRHRAMTMTPFQFRHWVCTECGGKVLCFFGGLDVDADGVTIYTGADFGCDCKRLNELEPCPPEWQFR